MSNSNIQLDPVDRNRLDNLVKGLTVNSEHQRMIHARIGLITVDRLMDAATHKQRFENNADVPDLSLRENNYMLKCAAKMILDDSSAGETIQTMADKVVVLCAILIDTKTWSHLDRPTILGTLNTVFSQYSAQEFGKRVQFSITRCMGLNMAARARANDPLPPPPPMEKIDGGFYKKNYKRSIKTRKSRKLRSRR